MMSAGCGKVPTLKNSPGTITYNTITSGGTTRQYVLRYPDNYDNKKPYRLILGFHGAGGTARDVAPSFFGLWSLSNNTTIFVAADAGGSNKYWTDTQDVTLTDDILKQVQGDLCIDTTRIELEGFSQGAALVKILACRASGVFRAAVGHSAGGLPLPSTCPPIAYLGSLGLQESGGGDPQRPPQSGQTDLFAKAAGCTVETLPNAPKGGHLCSDYKMCSAGHPVRWCSYDGGHTPSPADSGQSASWMPKEVWAFFSQF